MLEIIVFSIKNYILTCRFSILDQRALPSCLRQSLSHRQNMVLAVDVRTDQLGLKFELLEFRIKIYFTWEMCSPGARRKRPCSGLCSGLLRRRRRPGRAAAEASSGGGAFFEKNAFLMTKRIYFKDKEGRLQRNSFPFLTSSSSSSSIVRRRRCVKKTGRDRHTKTAVFCPFPAIAGTDVVRTAECLTGVSVQNTAIPPPFFPHTIHGHT